MTKIFKWLNLQLFGGEGEGGGEGAATGADGAVDAGQQRLLELGVPADKIRKRANSSISAATAMPVIALMPTISRVMCC